MKTAVVILNWNTKDFLEKFLPPLIESTEGLDAEVIVADSASTDASMDMMSEKFPKIRQIRLEKNYGFTGGYNRSLALVDAEYYVLINSDIEVPKNWLSPLVEWMDTHPECGACGPKLHSWYDRDMFEYAGAAGGYLDRYGYPFCRGRVMSKIEKDTGQYDTPANVLWVSGACLMVRSSLWNSLGGLDDRFFAHMEEIDLCWRIQLSGFKVTVVPSSVVYHIGGGTLPKKSPYKLFLNYRNNLLMLENNLPKTIGRKRARRRILTRMILDGMSGIVYLITGKWESFKAVVKAHREYRKLRRRTDEDAHANIDGLVNYWMIPRNLLFLQK
jgi:GT2 family glycosyltransferase